MHPQRPFRMPWDEKTTPTPPPERVEIPKPWDEGTATKLPAPGVPPRGKGKPPK